MTKKIEPIHNKIVTTYKRRGLIYCSSVSWQFADSNLKHTITRKLGFISYNLIKLIHGKEKLDQMASYIPGEYL
jgi:hypothetical protein